MAPDFVGSCSAMAIHPPARGAGRALTTARYAIATAATGAATTIAKIPGLPVKGGAGVLRRALGAAGRLLELPLARAGFAPRDRPDGPFTAGSLGVPRRATRGALRYSGELSEAFSGLAPPGGLAGRRSARPSGQRPLDRRRAERRGPTRDSSGAGARSGLDTRPQHRETRKAIHGSSTAFPPMWIVAQRSCVGFVLRRVSRVDRPRVIRVRHANKA